MDLCNNGGSIAASEFRQLWNFQSNINQRFQHDAGLTQNIVLFVGIDVESGKEEKKNKKLNEISLKISKFTKSQFFTKNSGTELELN